MIRVVVRYGREVRISDLTGLIVGSNRRRRHRHSMMVCLCGLCNKIAFFHSTLLDRILSEPDRTQPSVAFNFPSLELVAFRINRRLNEVRRRHRGGGGGLVNAIL